MREFTFAVRVKCASEVTRAQRRIWRTCKICKRGVPIRPFLQLRVLFPDNNEHIVSTIQ